MKSQVLVSSDSIYKNVSDCHDIIDLQRAPKYADFKNKLTKEGLWITARWNPLWVRTELSLMTNFRAVPYDDPLWEEKRRLEEEEK